MREYTELTRIAELRREVISRTGYEERRAYDWIRAMVEAKCPELLRRLHPRIYQSVGGWCSPLMPAVQLAGSVDAYNDPTLSSGKEGDLITMMIVATAGRLLEYDVPTFFVGRDLLEAVADTEPPADLRWTDVPLPFPAGLLLFPTGSVKSTEGWAFDYASWCRIEVGRHISIPGSGELRFEHDSLVVTTASADDPNFQGYGKNLSQHSWPWARMPETQPAGEITNLEQSETDFVHRLVHLTLMLLLVRDTNPELATPGVRQKAQRRGARDIWTPHYLGLKYRLPARKPWQGGTHSSPRGHQISGHFTHQVRGDYRQSADFVSAADLPRARRGEIDWTQVSEEMRQRFWRPHQRRWIMPYEAGGEPEGKL